MKIQTTTKELSKALDRVRGFVPARAMLPICQSVLVRANSRVTLIATDLQKGITVTVEGARGKGAICLPAKALERAISTLPDGDMTIEVKGKAAVISCGNAEVNLEGQDPQDFPPIPAKPKGGVRLTIDAQTLAKAIERTAYAAATEDSRPVLTGIVLDVQGNRATFAAADGFRLAVQEVDIRGKGKYKVIIPVETMAQVRRIINKQVGKVGIILHEGKKRAFFTFSGTEVVTQLIEGTYPNYGYLIPQSWTTKLVWVSEEIARAVGTVSKFGPASGIVRIIAKDGQTVLTAITEEEVTGEISLKVATKIEGEPGRIAVNIKYLADAIKACGGDEVSLEFTQPHSPMVFRKVGDDSYLVTVMPMFIQW